MKDVVKIIPLAGMDESIKDLVAIDINNDIYIINVGASFPDKSKPGIDYVIPNFDYLIENKDRVKGYFITRGHDCEFAGLLFLYDKVPAPIYVTKTTRLFMESLCVHRHIDKKKFNFVMVEPSSTLTVAGREIALFSTCCNVSDSYGVAIWTDGGYIVYSDNFVIDTNYDPGFITNTSSMVHIADKGILLLMVEADGSEIIGYASPKYKLVPQIERIVKDAPGKIVVAIDAPDVYNIAQTAKLMQKHHRRIFAFDSVSREQIMYLGATGLVKFGRDDIGSIDDINHYRAKDVCVLISGFGTKFYEKIKNFSSSTCDSIFKLSDNDTFIYGSHTSTFDESEYTESVDELYRTGCNVVYFSKKNYSKMHAAEEDIKAIINIFKPKYLLPVHGTFKELLACAKLAVNMGVGLSHHNVFIMDNGMILEINEQKAFIHPEKVPSDNRYIDGRTIGSLASSVMEERQVFSDGVIILGATVSKSQRQIVGGPDIQMRGLVYVKESENLLKEIQTIFISNIKSCLAKTIFSKTEAELNTKEQAFRAVRRTTLKSPMIIPIIAVIE